MKNALGILGMDKLISALVARMVNPFMVRQAHHERCDASMVRQAHHERCDASMVRQAHHERCDASMVRQAHHDWLSLFSVDPFYEGKN